MNELTVREEKIMQKGSLVRRARHSQSEVWEYRWREPGPTGTRRHRRIVVGSTDQIADESAARQAVAALQIEINQNRKSTQPAITIGNLVQHFQQRELRPEFAWRTFSTRSSYEGNLRKWIVPRWSEHPVDTLNAGEVELWLRSLPLARASCAKIRNLMSMLFNHGVRHGICGKNPIELVRQGAKRKKIPIVLTSDEVRRLIEALPLRERTLVLLAAGSGLRMSELFALKWSDVHFDRHEISVIRSIVMQVVGPCKTEASQRSIPMDPCLAEALEVWRAQSHYHAEGDWVFASGKSRGRWPYWGQPIMRKSIRPIAIKLGISSRLGWHTFRHTYATLLRATGADIKVMQELLRHASARVTLDTYTQAVTDKKRKAQTKVVRLFTSGERRKQ
jgi:integrase